MTDGRDDTALIYHDSVEPIDFDGLRIFDYTSGRPWSSSLAVIEVRPGARHKEAWSRRSDKYYLVTAGEIEFVIDGTQHAMAAWDFCFVRQGQRFSYVNGGSRPAMLVLFHTPGFDLDDEVFVES